MHSSCSNLCSNKTSRPMSCPSVSDKIINLGVNEILMFSVDITYDSWWCFELIWCLIHSQLLSSSVFDEWLLHRCIVQSLLEIMWASAIKWLVYTHDIDLVRLIELSHSITVWCRCSSKVVRSTSCLFHFPSYILSRQLSHLTINVRQLIIIPHCRVMLLLC